MGNVESELNKNDKLTARDKRKNFTTESTTTRNYKEANSARGMKKHRDKWMILKKSTDGSKSKNPLLTNPEVQREFLRNKRCSKNYKKSESAKAQQEDSSYDKNK